MKTNPKVSIVTAVYNGSHYLEETILSVINQTYTNIEYIIIDGGSNDGTVDIIKKYSDKLSYWISEIDNGMYDGIAKGFERATGDIFAYINSDDIFQPSAVQTVVDVMTSNPDVKWLSGMQVVYNSKSVIVKSFTPIPQTPEEIQKRYFPIQQESTFWTKDLYFSIDIERFRNMRLAGDYYMWFCFSKVAQRYVVEALLGGFRRHDVQLSSNYSKYKKELDSFCVPMSFIDIIKRFFISQIYTRFPNRVIRKFITNNKILYWDFNENLYKLL